MRSSTGQHWIALDHARALAAFAVFTWHFVHGATGFPVPFAGAPKIWPLALLDEGHTGVALFMTLSGYLFAKLLGKGQINYPAFFWNRFVRLAPMMIVAVLVGEVVRWSTAGQVPEAADFLAIVRGFVQQDQPLPHGLWSVVVETQFYAALPLIILASRGQGWVLFLCLGLAIAARLSLIGQGALLKYLSYWTIGGRIDQFLLGMIVARHGRWLRGRHGLAVLAAGAFCAFYAWFDAAGGWQAYDHRGMRSLLWVFISTIEGAAYALLIGWYDASFRPQATGLSGLIAKAGSYSYSIYLLHFFVVFSLAKWINDHLFGLSNIYLACCGSLLCFIALIPLGWACFTWIEAPFLRLRRDYRHGQDKRTGSGAECRLRLVHPDSTATVPS